MQFRILRPSSAASACRVATGCLLYLIATLPGRVAHAQTKDWPFPAPSATRSPAALGAPSPTPPPGSTPPSFGATMRQLPWEKLSDTAISTVGTQALALQPLRWFHGETENFILHYRNTSDAMEIAREIEFDLWFVAKSLGATKDQYARKSHVYVFEDEKEWQAFLIQTHSAPWVHSFAVHDDLFLNIHGTGRGFDSGTLAHETTHAVVARIYGARRWPLWLSEGFAETMSDACGAARRGLSPQANPRLLHSATMTVTELMAVTHYPEDRAAVTALYRTGLKFVRYLFAKYPATLFPKFVEAQLAGTPPATALHDVYGEEFRDLPAFEKRFATLIR